MALIKCSECGKEISDKASACPSCGAPIEKEEQKKEPPKPVTKKKTPFNKGTKTGIAIAVIAVAIMGGVALYDNMYNSYDGGGNGGYNTYEEKVMTVEETEQANPARFLEAGGTYNDNFWGDRLRIQGTVKNKATVANYKDVVIEVTYFTKTNTELGSERYVVYNHFPAHTSKDFFLKVNRPSSCRKLNWEAVGATAY